MRLLSWNVQGLGGHLFKRMRGRLRLELQTVLIGGPIDVLLLQEHHLNECRSRSYGSILQGRWIKYWSFGIGPYGSNGGVCMSVNAKWKDQIVDYVEVIPRICCFQAKRYSIWMLEYLCTKSS